ncbi:hypothetical protein PGB90_007479 [Kerria lacca]
MEEMNTDSDLVIKALEFLESRKYSNNLTEIIASLDVPDTTAEGISVLQFLFMEILKRRNMLISPTDNLKTETPLSKYVLWLQKSYKNVWKKLIGLMSHVTFSEQAMIALFALLKQEGKFPIVSPNKRVYYFPEARLKMILKKCFITKFHFSGVQNQLDEFTNFIDIAYYFWIITPKLLENLKGLNEKLISHILDILQKIPIPSENELKDLTEDLLFYKPKFKPKYTVLQESIQNLWNIILRWKCRNNNHKKTLMLLLDNIMPHLAKPILTMDYFMESLDSGGGIPLLALQGIFVLVKDHNLHLPVVLIASFVKRFSRLCLCAPPADIIVLSAFIGNLLIRHPTLKIMIQHPTIKSVPTDPFIENEENPYKTNAIESSLWELETLQQHILPDVSKAVSFIKRPFPKTEWDLTSLIGITYAQIFEKQSKKKIQKVSLTFEQPESLALPHTNYFSNEPRGFGGIDVISGCLGCCCKRVGSSLEATKDRSGIQRM